MNVRNLILLFALFVFSNFSCEKQSDVTDLDNKNGCEAEIFLLVHTNIYGTWQIESISGGITGDGYTPDFDYISIEKYGIYEIYKEDVKLEFGKIIIEEQTEDTLVISFSSDALSDTLMYDAIKIVNMPNVNELNLIAPCCDRYNYHFTRKTE